MGSWFIRRDRVRIEGEVEDEDEDEGVVVVVTQRAWPCKPISPCVEIEAPAAGDGRDGGVCVCVCV